MDAILNIADLEAQLAAAKAAQKQLSKDWTAALREDRERTVKAQRKEQRAATRAQAREMLAEAKAQAVKEVVALLAEKGLTLAEFRKLAKKVAA